MYDLLRLLEGSNICRLFGNIVIVVGVSYENVSNPSKRLLARSQLIYR